MSNAFKNTLRLAILGDATRWPASATSSGGAESWVEDGSEALKSPRTLTPHTAIYTTHVFAFAELHNVLATEIMRSDDRKIVISRLEDKQRTPSAAMSRCCAASWQNPCTTGQFRTMPQYHPYLCYQFQAQDILAIRVAAPSRQRRVYRSQSLFGLLSVSS